MSKLSDALRAIRVFNTHGIMFRFGGERDVAICYHPTESGRACSPAKAVVLSPHFKTDPESAWYNYGNKAFVGNRKLSVPAAKAWAAKHYGITEWAADPTDRSNLIPAHVRKAAEQFIKRGTTP